MFIQHVNEEVINSSLCRPRKVVRVLVICCYEFQPISVAPLNPQVGNI